MNMIAKRDKIQCAELSCMRSMKNINWERNYSTWSYAHENADANN